VYLRFLISDFRFQSQIANRKSEIVWCLVFSLWFIQLVYAGGEVEPTRPSWESQRYLIDGVHYLINEGDRDMAKSLFQKAILSSSFSSLSGELEDQSQNRWVAAEAFYFLGKICYEKAILDTGKEKQESSIQYPASSIENIAWAKKYLEKADEYGMVYDRMHPPLLDKINREYPGVDPPIMEANRDKAKITIKTDHGSYQIDAVRVDQHADVTENTFLTNREFDVECGARYKVKPDIQGGRRSIYRALAVLGISLAIWRVRS